MAKKSRKVRVSDSSLLRWPKVLVIIIPLFAALLIMFNSSNGRSVLGVSDSTVLNLNKDKRDASSSASKCKQNKVSSFSVSGLCDSNKNGYKQVKYTCADGMRGSITNKDCTPMQLAFEKAIKACSKNSACGKKAKPVLHLKKEKQKSVAEK